MKILGKKKELLLLPNIRKWNAFYSYFLFLKYLDTNFSESKTENNILLTFLGARHHGFAVGPLAAPKNVNKMLFLQFLLRKIRVDLLQKQKVTVKCIPFPNVFEATLSVEAGSRLYDYLKSSRMWAKLTH